MRRSCSRISSNRVSALPSKLPGGLPGIKEQRVGQRTGLNAAPLYLYCVRSFRRQGWGLGFRYGLKVAGHH